MRSLNPTLDGPILPYIARAGVMIRCLQKDEHKGYICRKHFADKISVYCYDVGCSKKTLMQKFNIYRKHVAEKKNFQNIHLIKNIKVK